MGPYRWHLPCGTLPRDCVWVWVGPDDSPVLTQLQMWRNDSHWVMWDPCEDRWQEGIPLEIIRTLKRRYYLVEKARNAHIVGEMALERLPSACKLLHSSCSTSHLAVPHESWCMQTKMPH